MNDFDQKRLDLLDNPIDDMCEEDGVRQTIYRLMEDYDFTKEELMRPEMRFQENDINAVIKGKKKYMY